MFTFALIATILFVSLLGWGFVVARLRRGLPVLSYEHRRPVPWTGTDIPLLFAPVILGVIARLVTIWRTDAAGDEPVIASELAEQLLQAIALNAGMSCIFAVAVLAFVKFFRHAAWQDIGFDRRKLILDLQLGAVAFATVAPPIYMLQALLTQWYEPGHPLVTVLQQQPGALVWLLCGVSAVVVAPIYEELMFRVLLQGWLEKLFNRHSSSPGSLDSGQSYDEPRSGAEFGRPMEGSAANVLDATTQTAYADVETIDEQAEGRSTSWLPILFSSALFALLHLGHGPAPIPLFFLALALGYIYQRTHRVLPCIILHALLNGTSLAMLALGAE